MKNIKVKKIKLRKRKEKKLIWNKTKQYILLWIIACCLAIGLNIHPQNSSLNTDEMIYVFHDYERNIYILNDTTHWSADNINYLFNDNIPEELKWRHNTNTTSTNDSEINDTNDNQITIEEIMNELWIDNEYSWNILIVDKSTPWTDKNTLIIDLNNWEKESQSENYNEYNVERDWPTLTITKFKSFTTLKNKWNFSDNDWKKHKSIKSFKTIAETRILPSLIPWNQLENLNDNSYTSYSETNENSGNNTENYTENNEDYEIIWWINILPNYADCTTPRWYKISHWESVLAYKQMDNAPNICNIERRYCWNWKLSGSYPQQGCSVKSSYYTYPQNSNTTKSSNTTSNSYTKSTSSQESYYTNENPTIEFNTQQNKDWSVTVYKTETKESFVFDRPSKASTDFYRWEDNIRTDKSVEQTEKEHINCITPRWEEVQHGQLVQAFKHANWFYDIPCETQVRLCSMWKLDGSYSQKSCKNWESSFKNRYNWWANKDKYYEEKLKKIKQKLENEETYYNEIKWLSEQEALDKIFYRLDE